MRGYDRDGFFRLDGFADPAVGEAMLADVVDLARRAAAGENVAPALPLPEAQAGLRGRRIPRT